jgi:tubulin-like protein CetZ
MNNMAKSFIKNKPAINMTVVGFGQAGSRIADNFAAFKDEAKNGVYNCLALNSNDGDLQGLQHIPVNNRVSLNLGGLGKNPQKAIKILEENQEVNDKLKQFIQKQVRPVDDLVLFCAGLGGGTGTSTIIKAIEEFYDFNTKPLIAEELKKIQADVGAEEFRKNLNTKYLKAAVLRARERSVKIGVIVTLPLRADGPDVLRQVNDFSQRIWKLAKDPTKGIGFVIFADNQHFYDEFKKIPSHLLETENYRDFANKEISDLFHELNTATTGGGTEVTFDSQDFRRIILENHGSLVINRVSKPLNEVQKGNDIKEMFLKSISGSILHEPIELENNENGQTELTEIYHVGLLAVLDNKKSLGSAFMDDARVEIAENPSFFMKGSIFTGYLEGHNDFAATVYTFYKANGLPNRLAKGLVKEFEEYQQRQNSIKTKDTSIGTIKTDEYDGIDFDLDLDLSEFGLDVTNESKNDKVEEEFDIDIDSLDLSKIKL